MRGRQEPQVTMLAFVDLEERVPAGHPLRSIKVLADEALARLSAELPARREQHRPATRMLQRIGLAGGDVPGRLYPEL